MYFPTGGFISLVTPVSVDTGVEMGLIGSESVLGITRMQGIAIVPFQAQEQGAGMR